MRIVTVKCTECRAAVHIDADLKTAFCPHCGTRAELPDVHREIVREHRKTVRIKPFFAVLTAAAFVAAIVLIIIAAGRCSKPETDERIYKTAGIYLAGTDIPAGEYVLYPETGVEETAAFEIRTVPGRIEEKSQLLCGKDFYTRQWVTLSEGEYLEFSHSNLYKPERMKIKALSETGFSAAQFKVGTDIPEGEYLICGEDKRLFYMISEKFSDGTQNLNAASVLEINNDCEYRVYVNVRAGEYLYFTAGRLYGLAFAPDIVKNEDGSFKPGQYKLGRDFQPGTYRVSPYSTGTHSYVVHQNMTRISFIEKLYPEHFLQGDDITEPATVDFSKFNATDNSVYVTLMRCTMKKY